MMSDVYAFISFTVNTACHKYSVNLTGFLVSCDMVQTLNILMFFTQNNFSNFFSLN